jgi:hypothetical protein
MDIFYKTLFADAVDDGDDEEEDEIPRISTARRISIGVADQYRHGTCYAHAISRVLTRYFYAHVEDLEEHNQECDNAIKMIQSTTFLDRKCSGVNRTKTNLYKLIYYYLVHVYSSTGGPPNKPAIVNVGGLLNALRMTETTYDLQHRISAYLGQYSLPVDDLQSILDILHRSAPIGLLEFANVVDITKHISQGYYLAYYINDFMCHHLMTFYTDYPAIEYPAIEYPGDIKDRNEREKYKIGINYYGPENHTIAIVIRRGDWFGAKNSWGDTRLVWIHKSNIKPDCCIGVAPSNNGGHFKRQTKKYKTKGRQRKTKGRQRK